MFCRELLFTLLLIFVAVALAQEISDDDVFELASDATNPKRNIQANKLILALSTAAELEHSVMIEYLFSKATLKRDMSDFTHPTRKYHQFELVRRWRRQLSYVAREEMQHWSFVSAILNSLGIQPAIYHPEFPHKSVLLMKLASAKKMQAKHMQHSLRPLSFKRVKKFISYEHKHVSNPKTVDLNILTSKERFTISDLYFAIRNEIKQLTDDQLMIIRNNTELADFALTNSRDQLNSRRRIIPYSPMTKERMLKMILEIVEEGEGASKNLDSELAKMNPRDMFRFIKVYQEQSHLQVFTEMLKEYKEELKHDPNFNPSKDVVENPTIFKPIPGATLIPSAEERRRDPHFTHRFEYRILNLFQKTYTALLLLLQQWHTTTGSHQTLSAIHKLAFMPLMAEIIQPFSHIIPLIQYKGKYLSPNFEIPSDLTAPQTESEYIALHTRNLRELTALYKEMNDYLETNAYMHRLNRDFTGTFAYITESMSLVSQQYEFMTCADFTKNITDLVSDPVIDRRVLPEKPIAKSETPILKIKFRGRFQSRFATDPDSSIEPYGFAGSVFAWVGEPKLSRVLMFNGKKAFRRLHTPRIGVKVIDAKVVKGLQDQETIVRDLNKFLAGAKVDFVGAPVFEGRNYAVAEPPEPIDNLNIQISNKHFKVVKKTGGPSLLQMSSRERQFAMLGRRPKMIFSVNGVTKEYAFKEAGVSNLEEFYKKHYNGIKNGHQEVKKQLEANPKSAKLLMLDAQYSARLRDSEWVFATAIRGMVRRKVMFNSAAYYQHTMAGAAHVKRLSRELGIKLLSNTSVKEYLHRWQIGFELAAYDYDSASGVIDGELLIPVELLK